MKKQHLLTKLSLFAIIAISISGTVNANSVSISESDGIATITDGTNSTQVYTKETAENIFSEKQQWVDNTLGITSAQADAVKTALTGNIAGEQTTITAAINTLDSAIEDRTVSVSNGIATITDGTNSTTVYTKETAENIFSEKQQWVDNTLGITSAQADAVKTALTGNIAGEQTTITAAINTLDSAIEAEATARAAGDAMTLNTANAYTDKKIDNLDKDLSAGIAAATALSAVEVSNVEKGEVSFGAGYGSYNGESAGAFGAAMGITNNWSVNLGAGISSSDTAFRAGTNYKFKMF